MRQPVFLLLAAFAVAVAARPATAQKFQPKNIQFQGDPEYSNNELLTATGLKKGVALSSADMQDYSKRLLDSGVFASVAFKFDGQDLIFQLTPAAGLCNVQLENLPLTPGAKLDADLHAQIPLYHGKVPAQGGLTDAVGAALEQMLVAKGLKATVIATACQAQTEGGFVSFVIESPAVVVGKIQIASTSAALDDGAQKILAKMTGAPYSATGTISQLTTYLGNYYRDKGYLEVEAHAAQTGDFSETDAAIQVPFEISVSPGLQYRLSGVQFAPDIPVTQADFYRQSAIHSGDIADGQHLTDDWQYASRQFHNLGYMMASVHPAPTFDHEKSTVSFMVTADPGAVYTMGALTVENVSDELRAAILAAWKMPQGSVFNEGAARGFFATHGVNPALERVFAAVNGSFSEHLNDSNHSVDVVIKLEKKP
jgi:outer membrane protein assembly factor BamA